MNAAQRRVGIAIEAGRDLHQRNCDDCAWHRKQRLNPNRCGRLCGVIHCTLIYPGFYDVDVCLGEHATRRHDSSGITLELLYQVAVSRIECLDTHQRAITNAGNADQHRKTTRSLQIELAGRCTSRMTTARTSRREDLCLNIGENRS